MSDALLEKKLYEEVLFWQEYIDRNLGQQEQLSPRMYKALDFAKQRLETYLTRHISINDKKIK